MAESLATRLLSADLEAACPACTYPMWVRYSEIVAHSTVVCPCCHAHIPLVDEAGGAQNAGDTIEQQIARSLKGLFR